MEPTRLPEIGGVALYLVQGVGSEPHRGRLYALLSAEERARAERFKVERARRSFVVSRGTLRTILGREVGCDPGAVVFGEGRHGKPFLSGAHRDAGVEFNVSHSGDVFLYALARGRTLGVDVERKRPDRPFERLAERYFAPGETESLLAAGSAKEREEAFYRCWTRKEAYLKAKGTGLTTRLHAFEVTLARDAPAALRHTEVEGEDPSDWRVFDVPVPAGYAGALVVRRV